MKSVYKLGALPALVFLLTLPIWSEGTQATQSMDTAIVTTAERTPQRTSDSITAATVITAKEIKELGLQSVADVLRLAPGVTIRRTGEFGAPAFARIRGTDSSQVLVLVNGLRISSPAFLDGADLSRFTVEDIARIEIVRGPMSSLYGSDAMGGVINIITEQSEIKKSEANVGFGSNGRAARSLILSGGKKLGWEIRTSVPRYSGARLNSGYSATHLTTRITLPSVSGWKLNFNGATYNDSVGLPGPAFRANKLYSYGTLSSEADPDDNQWAERTSFDVSADRTLGKGSLSFHSYRQEQEFHTAMDMADVIITGKADTSELNYHFIQGPHDIIIGGELRDDKFENNDLLASTVTKNDITNLGILIQDRVRMDPRTNIVVGARYDDHSVAGSQTSPRIGLIHALPNGIKLRASYGEAFRAPSFIELYYDSEWSKGNPNLKPEELRGYEFGMSSQWGDDNVDIAFFSNDIRDKIDWVYDSETYINTYQNIDRTRERGIEFAWGHRVSPTGRFDASYTFLDARDRATGSRILGVPTRQLRLSTTGRYSSWVVMLSGRWNNSYRDLGGLRVDGRAIFDLALQHRGEGAFNPYVILRNLTNTKYQEAAGYPAEGQGIEVGMFSAW